MTEMIAIATVALTTASFAVTLILLVYKIGIWRGRVSEKVKQLEGAAENDRKNFRDTVENFRKEVRESAENFRKEVRESAENFRREMREDIGKIQDQIVEIFKRLPPIPPTVGGASPLSLTEFGREISQDLDADKWANGIYESLQKQVQGKPEYIFQEVCMEYVRNELPENMKEKVKEVAYNRGIEDKKQVEWVLVVVLRDKLLATTAHGGRDLQYGHNASV